MENLDDKRFGIDGKEVSLKGTLSISASGVAMPDGKTLADTIITMNNRIQKLEETVEQLRKKS